MKWSVDTNKYLILVMEVEWQWGESRRILKTMIEKVQIVLDRLLIEIWTLRMLSMGSQKKVRNMYVIGYREKKYAC